MTVSQKYFTFFLVADVAADILGATLKAFLLTLLTAAAVGSSTSIAVAQDAVSHEKVLTQILIDNGDPFSTTNERFQSVSRGIMIWQSKMPTMKP